MAGSERAGNLGADGVRAVAGGRTVTRLGRRIQIRGVVQGVGFRPWVYRLAAEEGVAGRVCNDAAGVTIDAFGPSEVLDDFLRRLTRDAPDAAEIRELHAQPIPAELLDAFSIVDSVPRADREISIPPDLATCPACLHDISNPSDRRYEYPFTNCTNCGPRFTIAHDTPYDRTATTMAAFTMCAACQEEYASVEDRRFHAQPNACPRCGPALTLATAEGTAIDSRNPIADAAAALRLGKIVAVKGLGGFHLACDATVAEVVARLRLAEAARCQAVCGHGERSARRACDRRADGSRRAAADRCRTADRAGPAA